MWSFPSTTQLVVVAIVIACIGAATLKGCEYGCSYLSSKVELRWKGGVE